MIIGILQKATTAKTETEKGQEKEIVALAYNSALAKKVSNNDSTAVTEDDLNPELTNQGASADGSNPITVTFTNSKRQYIINSNGTIEYAGIQSEDDDIVPQGKVAKIGTTYYETLQDAFDAVANDNTQTEVILLTNISENVLVEGNKNIILDLNSKTITNVNRTIQKEMEGDTFEQLQSTIEIEESGILKLKNGNITADYGMGIECYGTVNIESGTYTASSNILCVNMGTMNIYDGNFYGSAGGEIEDGFQEIPTIANAGQLTITEGTITSTESSAISNVGTLLITGGTISNLAGGNAIYNEGGTANVSNATINGITIGLD